MPGPLGTSGNSPVIDSGTLSLSANTPPGPTCVTRVPPSAQNNTDISRSDGERVVVEAITWIGTPYALIGQSSAKQHGGDCSGSTLKIFVAVGFRYIYQASGTFRHYAASTGIFRQLLASESMQSGDILSWPNHMAVHAEFAATDSPRHDRPSQQQRHALDAKEQHADGDPSWRRGLSGRRAAIFSRRPAQGLSLSAHCGWRMPSLMRPLIAISVLFAASSSDANDASMGVAFPPLKAVARSPAPEPLEAAIQLDGEQTHIRFTLRPSGEQSLKRKVELAWPAYGWLGASEPYPVRHAPELRITVDGEPAEVENIVQAFADDNRSITALLESARIDPWLINESPPMVSMPSNADAASALVKVGAITAEDGQFLAHWRAARRLRFGVPPKATRLTLSYTAMPGFALLDAGGILPSAMWPGPCAPPPQMNAIVRNGAWSARSYIFPISVAGRLPRRVRLELTRPSTPRAMVAVCTPGGGRLILVAQAVTSFAVVAKHGAVYLLVLSPSTPSG